MASVSLTCDADDVESTTYIGLFIKTGHAFKATTMM